MKHTHTNTHDIVKNFFSLLGIIVIGIVLLFLLLLLAKAPIITQVFYTFLDSVLLYFVYFLVLMSTFSLGALVISLKCKRKIKSLLRDRNQFKKESDTANTQVNELKATVRKQEEIIMSLEAQLDVYKKRDFIRALERDTADLHSDPVEIPNLQDSDET